MYSKLCLYHQAFIPERFLPENFDKMDNFAFVPFSAGPRYIHTYSRHHINISWRLQINWR